MKIFGNKKSEALTAVLIVLVIAVFLGWLINLGSRECYSNNDCGNGQYCGSDFACHQIPTIEKTVVQNSFIIPSIIIALAIIIASIILKYNRPNPINKNNQEIKQEQTPNKLKMP